MGDVRQLLTGFGDLDGGSSPCYRFLLYPFKEAGCPLESSCPLEPLGYEVSGIALIPASAHVLQRKQGQCPLPTVMEIHVADAAENVCVHN